MEPSTTDAACSAAALQVVTSAMLLPAIGSFLPGVPVWTLEYEHRHGPKTTAAHSRDERAKQTMGTPGLLSRLAIQQRDLHTLKRLHALQSPLDLMERGKFTTAVRDAATARNLEALQWLSERTTAPCPLGTLDGAVMNGHAEVVRWLLDHRPRALPITRAMLETSARHGHLEVSRVLHEQSPLRCSKEAIDHAAQCGHYEVIAFLLEGDRSDGCTTAAADGAAANGHYPVLQWLLKSRAEGFTEDAAYGAATHGHVDVLELLWDKQHLAKGMGSPSEVLHRGLRRAIPQALRSGNVGIIEWLHRRVGDLFPAFADRGGFVGEPERRQVSPSHGPLV